MRVVAATSRGERLLPDLVYRFSERITVPPLRERRGELPVLIDSLWKNSEHRKRCPRVRFPKPERARLAQSPHPWNGNVRELKSALESAVLRCRGSLSLTAADVLAQAK